MQIDIKHSKQTMLGDPQETHKAEPTETTSPKQKKQIEITEIGSSTREDELVLKVGFRLLPSRTAFSRIASDLYFDEEKIESLRLRILQGPLATDESEFSCVLDMTGISPGHHMLRVEMYELWSLGEKITNALKEASIEYIPPRKEERLIKVPLIKRTSGTCLEVISDSEKNIYREIEREMKKDSLSRRDNWKN